jgi:adenine-specific DNA-methyltransferase
MEKLDLKTPDFTKEKIAKLAELLPTCVTEKKNDKGEIDYAIDFDALRQELSKTIVEGSQERYSLNWPGKREALVTANTPTSKTLRPCREESVDFDTTKNIFIEGDNLDALKLLQETYLNKIKMIYIDPPYNTGNDFIYNDNFTADKGEYDEASGQCDEEGGRLIANTDSNGRYHSDWLSMILPRLRLAKNLLSDDGVIFISIDDNEGHNLRKVCDEVFGQQNFVAQFVWAAGRKNDSKQVSVSHEYIIAYVRNKEYLKENKIIWRNRKTGLEDIYRAYNKIKKNNGSDYAAMTIELKEWYKNLVDGHPAKRHKQYNNIDERGVYFPSDISWPGGGGPKYEVFHPVTNKPCKIPSRGWTFSHIEKMQEKIEDNRVHFGEEDSVPCLKSYLEDHELEVPYSVIYKDGRASTKRLRTLMGDDVFDHPKDEYMLADLIEFCTNENDIICDFFAGSGTASHALFLANAKQKLFRKFLLVQLPESIDSNVETGKRKKLLQRTEKFLDSLGKARNIAEISKERIRRAGKKVKEDNASKDGIENLDIGFRVFKIDSSNMVDVTLSPDETKPELFDSLVDNFKKDRSSEDLLFQVLLDWGVDLSLSIEKQKVGGKEVFFVDGNALAACFDGDINEDFVKELAERQPLRIVFRDDGFTSDSVKINVEQIFKLKSPTTDIKVI